jgi:hypothetical protein
MAEEKKRSFFGFSYSKPAKGSKSKLPSDPTQLWQDVEVLFDLPASCLRLRKGEVLLDSLASVEDSKSGGLSKGTLMLTNLRLTFVEAKTGQNISIGFGGVVKSNIRNVTTFKKSPAASAAAAAIAVQTAPATTSTTSAVSPPTSSSSSIQQSASSTRALVVHARDAEKKRFEFVFTAPESRQHPRLFLRFRSCSLAYENTKLYREVVPRGAMTVRHGKLRLLTSAQKHLKSTEPARETAAAAAVIGGPDNSNSGAAAAAQAQAQAVAASAQSRQAGIELVAAQEAAKESNGLSEEVVVDTLRGVFNLSGTGSGHGNSGGTIGNMFLTNIRVVRDEGCARVRD